MAPGKRSRKVAPIAESNMAVDVQPFRFFALPAEVRQLIYVQLAIMSTLFITEYHTAHPMIPYFLHAFILSSRRCHAEMVQEWPRIFHFSTMSMRHRDITQALEVFSRPNFNIDLYPRLRLLPTAAHSIHRVEIPIVNRFMLHGQTYLYYPWIQSVDVLKALQKLDFSLVADVSANTDGSFRLIDRSGRPSGATYATTCEYAKLLKKDWVLERMFGRGALGGRLKSAIVKAIKRKELVQSTIYFRVFVEFYTPEEMVEINGRKKAAGAAAAQVIMEVTE